MGCAGYVSYGTMLIEGPGTHMEQQPIMQRFN